MIAIMLGELLNWRNKYGIIGIAITLCLLSFAGTYLFLKPDIVFYLIIFLSIIFGYHAGKDVSVSKKSIDIFNYDIGISFKIVTAKILSISIIALLHILFISPLFIFLNIVWGVEIFQLLKILPLLLINILSVTIISFTGSNLYYTEDYSLPKILVVVWSTLSFLIQDINPFYLTGTILLNDNSVNYIFHLFIQALCTILFFLISLIIQHFFNR